MGDIAMTRSLRGDVDSKLDFYKLLIDYTDLPTAVVKNKEISQRLYGGVRGNCSRNALSKWVCYE